jgi:hypothetical protein
LFLNLNEIKIIQMDHTSRCHLACPQCARFHGSQTELNPHMPIADTTVDDYKIILEPFDRDSVKLFHCGNFGDSLSSPTLDDCIDYSISQGVKEFKMAVNGSARTPAWWRDLAQKSDRITVNFSIDGLADTNHLYRVNSNFDKIMTNAQAFIDAGGNARWYFIEFEHNYHQIETAKQMATDMGFKQFNAKYTGRFAEQQQKQIETRKGSVVKDKKDNHNQSEKTYDSFDQYIEQTPITCKYKQENSVFIDMNMRLWPCTWMGAPAYFGPHNPQRQSFDNIYNLYGQDFNDMRTHGWDVLQHDFFAKYLDRSWHNADEKYKRIYTCGRTCGDKFEFSSGYGKNTKRVNL